MSSSFYSESGTPSCCPVTVGQRIDKMLTPTILCHMKESFRSASLWSTGRFLFLYPNLVLSLRPAPSMETGSTDYASSLTWSLITSISHSHTTSVMSKPSNQYFKHKCFSFSTQNSIWHGFIASDHLHIMLRKLWQRKWALVMMVRRRWTLLL